MLRFRKPVVLALTLLTVSAAGFASFADGLVTGALSSLLEQRFARAVVDDWSSIDGLIVPGGSTDRTAEAIRLAQLNPHLKIVLSGPSEAEIARASAIDGLHVLVDRRPQNTFENAAFSKALVGSVDGNSKWLLVTSATHMPRAMGSFLAVGFPVVPWPVADRAREALGEVAAHEWLGLVAYWIRGRSIALLPGEADVRKAGSRLTHKG